MRTPGAAPSVSSASAATAARQCSQVEHEKESPVSQERRDRLAGMVCDAAEPERGRDRIRDEIRIRDGPEVHEAGAVRMAREQRRRDGHRYGRLADSPRTGDGQESTSHHALAERTHDVVASDGSREPDRQVACADDVAGRGRVGASDTRHAGGEPISAARDGDHVARPAASVTERLPQRCDLRTQIGFVDHGIRPRPRDELLLRHQLPCVDHQLEQDLERAAADRYRPAALEKQVTVRVDPEGAEGEHIARRRFPSIHVLRAHPRLPRTSTCGCEAA